MISPQEKKALKMLIQDQKYEIVLKVVNLLTDKWNDEPKRGSDEFDTIWNMAKNEGKKEGVKNLLDNLEELAND